MYLISNMFAVVVWNSSYRYEDQLLKSVDCVDSLNSTMVGVFTAWKSANITNEGLFFSSELVVKKFTQHSWVWEIQVGELVILVGGDNHFTTSFCTFGLGMCLFICNSSPKFWKKSVRRRVNCSIFSSETVKNVNSPHTHYFFLSA